MACESFQFYGPIDKVIFENISYIRRENQSYSLYANQEKCVSCIQTPAHDFFFCFLHELLMSFTTQFPNSRFDIRMTCLCKRKIQRNI